MINFYLKREYWKDTLNNIYEVCFYNERKCMLNRIVNSEVRNHKQGVLSIWGKAEDALMLFEAPEKMLKNMTKVNDEEIVGLLFK